MSVTDLDEFRQRRARERSEAMAGHPAMLRRPGESLLDLMRRANPEPLPTIPPARDRQGSKPDWVMVDEIHLWTDRNSTFDGFRRGYLNHLTGQGGAFEWADATPERREEVARALRILRSTDRGSSSGNTEGHRGDDQAVRGRPRLL